MNEHQNSQSYQNLNANLRQTERRVVLYDIPLPALLPWASGIRSHPPSPHVFQDGTIHDGIHISKDLHRADHQNSYPRGFGSLRTLTESVSISASNKYVRYLPRCTYPCVPGMPEGRRGPSGPFQPYGLPVWDLWQVRGHCPVVGRYTIMASSIPPAHQTLRKGGPPFSNVLGFRVAFAVWRLTTETSRERRARSRREFS